MEQTDALKSYMDAHYDESIFDELLKNGEEWVLHVHGHKTIVGSVVMNNKYDVVLTTKTQDRLPVTKHYIKFLYRVEHKEDLKSKIKMDRKVKKEEIGPILNPRKRNHIKNKTLFPLMNERTVLDFTSLEGDIVSGIIGGFTRYEITILGRGGVPVVFLRHAIQEVRDKRNKSHLKQAVEEKKVIVRKRIVPNR